MVKMHTRLELAIQLISFFSEGGALNLLSSAVAIDIFCNYVTIKLYSVLPFFFYFIFPCISMFLAGSLTMLLTIGHQVFDMSTELARIWPVILFKNRWNIELMRKTKETRKILRSIRPLRMYVGIEGTRFFFYKRSSKITILSETLICTINLLLGIPKHLVDEFLALVKAIIISK
jgi:hypothetical protein